MTQGSPLSPVPPHPLGPALNGHAIAPLDLDIELDELDLSPKAVKIGGKIYLVRRDLTGPEIQQYWNLVRAQNDAEALALLVGPEDGATLNAVLDALPQAKMQLIVKRIMQSAGLLLDDGGQSGESGAS